jgi:hypothetical protein
MKKLALGFVIFGILGGIVGYLWYQNSARLDDYYENPEIGDIYILYRGKLYAPMRINQVNERTISFSQYLFSFGQAVPDRELILDNEWDLNFDAVYERSELDRLWEEDVIVEIYRDE